MVKRVGKVDYTIDMHNKKKRHRTFHINMLRKWHTPVETVLLAEEVSDANSEDDIPLWKDDDPQKPVIGKQLSPRQKLELEKLLADIFRDSPGRTDLAEHHIDTGETTPVRLPPYRVPHAYRKEVETQLTKMLDAGIIEPSNRNWSAPMVLVHKKGKQMRICVDYRRLNSVSKMDAYPMPRIDDLIDLLGRAEYISKIDLIRGYWQVPLTKECREKSAFVTTYGLFQFNVMPFGLKGAPATFQRLIDRVIRGLGDRTAGYFDDLIIFSKTWEENLEHLQEVFNRLRSAGLTVKGKKCEFGVSHCIYLGFRVGSGTVQPEKSKIEAVKNMERPQTKKQVRTFLGLTGYYRRFIPHYSTVAASLSDLTRKSLPTQVVWSVECEKAFQELKNRLCSSPILYNPDFSRDFCLQTDASDRGCGAVLSQMDDDGFEHPVAYYSRKLLPREQKYSAIEKECLAIKSGTSFSRISAGQTVCCLYRPSFSSLVGSPQGYKFSSLSMESLSTTLQFQGGASGWN